MCRHPWHSDLSMAGQASLAATTCCLATADFFQTLLSVCAGRPCPRRLCTNCCVVISYFVLSSSSSLPDDPTRTQTRSLQVGLGALWLALLCNVIVVLFLQELHGNGTFLTSVQSHWCWCCGKQLAGSFSCKTSTDRLYQSSLTTFRNKPTTSSWVSLSTTTSKPSLHVDLKRLLNKFFFIAIRHCYSIFLLQSCSRDFSCR